MRYTEIPIYRTFTNWIITVFAGSILLPIVSQLLGGNSVFKIRHFFDGDTLGIIAIAIFMSAVCSLPALIILFLVHLSLNKQKTPVKKHQNTHNMAHFFVAFLTFGVLSIVLDDNEYGFLAAIAITYTLVGLTVWNITYALYKKRRSIAAVHEDELDGF